jgi:hypothetical protein
MSVATSEILKKKSFDNKTIIPNEMKPIEEMIKENGSRGQKFFLLGANRQKNLIIFFLLKSLGEIMAYNPPPLGHWSLVVGK